MSERPSTTNIPRDLHASIKATVRLVQKKTGRPYSLAQFFREASNRQLRDLWDTFNDGKPVTPDHQPLEPGRKS
ncbi:MAG TPA: hypothetical protein VGL36_35525 [Kribbella sp.]